MSNVFVSGILPANASGFVFDGQHSGQVYHLWLAKSLISLLPSTRDQFEEVPGLHGVYDFGAYYGAREIVLECVINAASEEELRTRARMVARWLNAGKGLKQLILDKEASKYYLVRYSGPVDIEQLAVQGKFSLSFVAPDPFAYDVTETVWSGQIAGGNSISLTNPGTFPTPVWFKAASGTEVYDELFPAMGLGVCPDVSLTANAYPTFVVNNDKYLKYNGILQGDDYLIIDTAKFEAKKNGQNVLGAIEGTWFELEPGINSFKYIDAALNTINLEIKFRGRWL